MSFRSNRRGIATAVVAGVTLLPLPQMFPSIASSSRVILQAGDTTREDFYAAGATIIIEGRVEGDLVAAAQDLIITGEISGDVTAVVRDKANISGVVGGSVRLATQRLDVSGTVGDDVAALALSVDVSGDVGRDVLVTTGHLDVSGRVGRDVAGQMLRADLDGSIGRDVEIAVRDLDLGPNLAVGGDLTYRARGEADAAGGATVAGQFVRRPSVTPFWLRVLQRVFSIVTLLGFLFAGIVLLWLARSTLPRAAGAVYAKPWSTLGIGLAVVVGTPLAVVMLGVTLVGLPLAVLFLVLWLLALFLGPLPAIMGAGERLLRGRGALYGGLVVGTLVWRGAMFLLPAVGALLYVAALLWGVGGWVQGAVGARAATRGPATSLPVGTVKVRKVPDDWQPPLAPLPSGDE